MKNGCIEERGTVMNRKGWDQLVSTAALVIAVVMLFVGAAAIYGGNFGRDNVTDRLAPEKVQFPPYEAMTPEEADRRRFVRRTAV